MDYKNLPGYLQCALKCSTLHILNLKAFGWTLCSPQLDPGFSLRGAAGRAVELLEQGAWMACLVGDGW